MDRTCFIYIHGVQPKLDTDKIGGYSKVFHKKILRELKKLKKDVSEVKRFEVNWADITFQFKRKLANLQFDADTKRHFKRRKSKPFVGGILRNFIYPAVLDILFYIKNKGSSDYPGEMLILERLHKKVKKAEKEGFKKVIIFAHSLGTVAAYDYIFRFRKKYEFPKNLELSAFVTFGSPIPLFAASMGYPISNKIKKPSYAKKWLNFWDYDDGVAGRCEPHFPKKFTTKFLKDISVNTHHYNPLGAHANYWTEGKVIKIMAKHLVKDRA